MFRFIDGLMALPKHLDKEFTTELESMEVFEKKLVEKRDTGNVS